MFLVCSVYPFKLRDRAIPNNIANTHSPMVPPPEDAVSVLVTGCAIELP